MSAIRGDKRDKRRSEETRNPMRAQPPREHTAARHGSPRATYASPREDTRQSGSPATEREDASDEEQGQDDDPSSQDGPAPQSKNDVNPDEADEDSKRRESDENDERDGGSGSQPDQSRTEDNDKDSLKEADEHDGRGVEQEGKGKKASRQQPKAVAGALSGTDDRYNEHDEDTQHSDQRHAQAVQMEVDTHEDVRCLTAVHIWLRFAY